LDGTVRKLLENGKLNCRKTALIYAEYEIKIEGGIINEWEKIL